MNVLSLFDGISCGKVALERAGIKISKYYASEIKKSALLCSQANHKDIIHLGDIKNININTIPDKIDLLIGGSPCQNFSVAGDKKGLDGNKSNLFYEYLRLLNQLKPKYFLLENVKMNKTSRKKIDFLLGVKAIEIDSSLVSYQRRIRLYWTNIPNVSIPKDKNINFQDYIGIGNLEEAKVNKTPSREKMWNNGNGKGDIKACVNITNRTKTNCLLCKQDRSPNSGLIQYKDFCRYLTRAEMEMAQTLPIGYTDCLSYRQAQDVLGDGWTVDVIAHILKNILD